MSNGINLDTPVQIQGEEGQGTEGVTPEGGKPAESQPEAPKDGTGTGTPDTGSEKKYKVPFLGEEKEVAGDEVVDLLKKSDAEVTRLQQELAKAKEKKSEPTGEDKKPTAEPAKEELAEEDPEVAAAVELLRKKGFLTQDVLDQMGYLKKEEVGEFVRDVLNGEKRIDQVVAQINALEQEYKDTPLAFKADDLAEYMQSRPGLTDPKDAFRLWKHDAIVEYEKSKGKEPTTLESPGKEPVKGTGEDVPETLRYSINNPDFDNVVKEDLEGKA